MALNDISGAQTLGRPDVEDIIQAKNLSLANRETILVCSSVESFEAKQGEYLKYRHLQAL